jgi:hypothetical protein
MSDKQAGRIQRHHRSRSEADGLAAEYEASGLSREEFCQKRNVALKSLSRYVTRYRKGKAGGSQAQELVAVELAGHKGCGGELVVLLASGRRIEIKRGFDTETLGQVVQVLERV